MKLNIYTSDRIFNSLPHEECLIIYILIGVGVGLHGPLDLLEHRDEYVGVLLIFSQSGNEKIQCLARI